MPLPDGREDLGRATRRFDYIPRETSRRRLPRRSPSHLEVVDRLSESAVYALVYALRDTHVTKHWVRLAAMDDTRTFATT